MLTSEAIHPEHNDRAAERITGSRIRRVQRVEPTEDGLLVVGEKANLGFRFISERIVRIKLFFSERTDWRTTPAVLAGAAAASNATVSLQVRETEDRYFMHAGFLELAVDKRGSTLVVRNDEGEMLFGEAEWSWEKKRITVSVRADAESHYFTTCTAC